LVISAKTFSEISACFELVVISAFFQRSVTGLTKTSFSSVVKRNLWKCGF